MALGTDVAGTHKFVSGKADGADVTLVKPSNWNANHNYGSGTDGQTMIRDSVAVDGASWVDQPMFHQGGARIQFNSTTQIQLNVGQIPLKLANGWITRTVTAAVTIANTGLAANTTFFVYAFDSAGVTTLEISATGHVTDATFGVEVKSGDATRTLVGMIRTGAGAPGVFQASPLTISWFNRKLTTQSAFFTANRSTGSQTFVELNAEIENNFVTWADSDVLITASGGCAVGVGGTGSITIGIDSTTVAQEASNQISTLTTSPLGLSLGIRLAEGFHFSTILALNDTGGDTTLCIGSATTGKRTVLKTTVLG